MELKTISFKGVTRTPDNIAAPGDLAVAMNVANDGAGLEMLEQPQAVFDLENGESFLAIHKGTGYLHYITGKEVEGTYTMYYVTIDGETVVRTDITTTNGEPSVEIIGNTIIYNDADGIHYLLWKDGEYINLGQKPPCIDIQFGLKSDMVAYPSSENAALFTERPYTSAVHLPVWCDGDGDTYVPPTAEFENYPSEYDDPMILTGNKDFPASYTLENTVASDEDSDTQTSAFVDRVTNNILGWVNKLVQAETEKGRFTMPFFVRYAYELFDGSYIMHSDPVLLIPNSKGPVFALDGKEGLQMRRRYKGDSAEKIVATFRGRAYAFASELQYSIPSISQGTRSAMGDWKDIVKGVAVFVTAPAFLYDQGGKVYGWKNMEDEGSWDGYFSQCVMNGQYDNEPLDVQYIDQSFKRVFEQRMTKMSTDSDKMFTPYDLGVTNPPEYTIPSYIMELPLRNEQEIRKKLVEESAFYQIAFFDLEEIVDTGGNMIKLPFEQDTLKHLTTQRTLADDYFSRDTISAGAMATYNHRLLLGDFSRNPHPPLPPFVAWPRFRNDTPKYWDIRVAIKNDDREIVVGNEIYSWNELTPAVLESFAVAYSYAQYYNNNGTCIASSNLTDLHVYKNLTPGDKLRITMTNQRGQMTTAAFLNGNINTEDPDASPGPSVLHNTNVSPAVAYVYLRANYTTPTSDVVVVTVPQGTDELAVTVYNNHNGTEASVIVEKLAQAQGVDELSRYDGVIPRFIFYPDPSAYKAQLFDGTTFKEVKLTPHIGLNGAYWLGDITKPDSSAGSLTIQPSHFKEPNVMPVEAQSELIASNTDNPFSFAPSNQDKIGSGRIIALCPAVRPLSEGQFGYANLYVFTTDGVWAMQVSTKDGTFSNIAPITRDVLSEGCKPLSLDTSVIFQAPRGIMLLTGSKAQCISEAINGDVWRVPDISPALDAALDSDAVTEAVADTLDTPIRTPALMAYDYTNQRVYVSPIGKAFSWVYNLKSGLWTQSMTHVTAAVNTYPGCVFAQDGYVVEILDGNLFDRCAIVTRPLSFAPLALQKFREVKGLAVDEGGTWCSVLWGTRDWRRYATISSNKAARPRMFRMGGSPWKAHVLGMFYAGGTPMSTAGASIAYDVEQNNRMR